jgi:hypothetical protein
MLELTWHQHEQGWLGGIVEPALPEGRNLFHLYTITGDSSTHLYQISRNETMFHRGYPLFSESLLQTQDIEFLKLLAQKDFEACFLDPITTLMNQHYLICYMQFLMEKTRLFHLPLKFSWINFVAFSFGKEEDYDTSLFHGLQSFGDYHKFENTDILMFKVLQAFANYLMRVFQSQRLLCLWTVGYFALILPGREIARCSDSLLQMNTELTLPINGEETHLVIRTGMTDIQPSDRDFDKVIQQAEFDFYKNQADWEWSNGFINGARYEKRN